MTTPPATPQPTTAEHLEAWRAAVLAYRRVRRRGELDHPARLAAVAAYLEVRPRDDREEAMRQVTRAIAYAATHHTVWFWRGVAVIVGLILLTAPPAAAAGRCERGPHAGPVTHVRDGDTVEVAGLQIRLQGLAAPELSEPGGRYADEEQEAARDGAEIAETYRLPGYCRAC
jgi:hypothetical protein